MNVDNTQLEKLLESAGLLVDITKVIGSTVLICYSSGGSNPVTFELYSQITSLSVTRQNERYSNSMRITLSTPVACNNEKIKCIYFGQPLDRKISPRWSISLEQVHDHNSIDLVISNFQILS